MRRTLVLSAVCLSVFVPSVAFGQSQPSIKYETDDVELAFHGRLQLQGWSSSCSGFVPGLPGNDPDTACQDGASPFDMFLRRARGSIQPLSA